MATSHGEGSMLVLGDISQAVLVKPGLKWTLDSAGSPRRGDWLSWASGQDFPRLQAFSKTAHHPNPHWKPLDIFTMVGRAAAGCEVTMVTGDRRQPLLCIPQPGRAAPRPQTPGETGGLQGGPAHRLPRGLPFSDRFPSGSTNSKAGF